MRRKEKRGKGWHKVIDTTALWKDIRFTSERHLRYTWYYCQRVKIILILPYSWFLRLTVKNLVYVDRCDDYGILWYNAWRRVDVRTRELRQHQH